MIYLDYQATAPIDPRVLNHMVECWAMESANPSSKHFKGNKSKSLAENARNKIANL
jgi:cysteine desulfurase